ncbi:MAG TPA: DUF1643 domain-containing protein [Propionibacteriaceae bacterium]
MSTYRYQLTRDLEPERISGDWNLYWIMLNPSTADEELDDPTIRRVKGFTARLGFSRLTVVNLYGLRATSPADLWTADDPIGPENDLAVKQAALHAAYFSSPIVAAWGALARPKRVEEVLALIRGVRAMGLLSCLGTTNSGAPRHPLYLRSDAPLVPWPEAS